ncbi:MAG: hypothetical protein Rubg2KO_07600 [Rubricoccaceae bacterium]
MLVSLAVAGIIVVVGASGDFIESSDETLLGAEVGDAERLDVEATTGLELPPDAVIHAYHFESALDQRMVALVSMSEKDAEAFLAQPPLDEAAWDPASSLPTATSDLANWPLSWGEPTQSGRRTTLDVAPGRQLGVSVGEASSDTRTLQITWTTF